MISRKSFMTILRVQLIEYFEFNTVRTIVVDVCSTIFLKQILGLSVFLVNGIIQNSL